MRLNLPSTDDVADFHTRKSSNVVAGEMIVKWSFRDFFKNLSSSFLKIPVNIRDGVTVRRGKTSRYVTAQ